MRRHCLSAITFRFMSSTLLNLFFLGKRILFLISWPLTMWPVGCAETSVRNYHYALRNITEDCISIVHRDGSLISFYYFFWGIPQGLNFMCRRFGITWSILEHAETSRNHPTRKNITFRRRWKFQIENSNVFFYIFSFLCYSYRKDERAKAVELVTKWCSFCSHIGLSLTTLFLCTFCSFSIIFSP